MNLLASLICSSPSSTKRLLYLHSISALHHCNFYSTKATSTIQKTQKCAKPKTQKSSEKSYSFAQTIRKQAEAPTAAWPKPQPIPYQPRAANSVNLIGNVEIPVKFVTDSDGKHFSATVISHGNEGGGRGSLSIPVVFEGDLAHVVACHVKENDCVSVSGQLSVDPLRCVLSESLGKIHVVAENINFVVGFDKCVFYRKVGIDELSKVRKNKNVEDKLDSSDDYVDYDNVSGVEFAAAVTLFEAETLPPQSVVVDNGKVASSTANVSSRSWKSGTKKKDANQILDLWSDLVKNPRQWWDYRGHKANELVKEKFPDFKQKETGESLWISSAPKWMLPEIGKLEFDVEEMKTDKVFGGGGQNSERKQNSDVEDSWKNLVGNPEKWWDNRARKKNSKWPDFRHKETGEALWLNRSPDWVLPKLPPVRGGQNAA